MCHQLDLNQHFKKQISMYFPYILKFLRGKLFGGTVPPNNTLFGGTVPPNSTEHRTPDSEKLFLIQFNEKFLTL